MINILLKTVKSREWIVGEEVRILFSVALSWSVWKNLDLKGKTCWVWFFPKLSLCLRQSIIVRMQLLQKKILTTNREKPTPLLLLRGQVRVHTSYSKGIMWLLRFLLSFLLKNLIPSFTCIGFVKNVISGGSNYLLIHVQFTKLL